MLLIFHNFILDNDPFMNRHKLNYSFDKIHFVFQDIQTFYSKPIGLGLKKLCPFQLLN